MLTSKVTSKGQVTLPKRVRDRLSVSPGDVLTYEFKEGDEVIVRKMKPFDRSWHEAVAATLTEWASPEDEEAYGGL